MLNDSLTSEEKEILVILMEECAELSQTCSKLLRAGKKPDFMANFKHELADVEVMIELVDSCGLSDGDRKELYYNKIKNLRRWSSIKI
jgi:hypothetical protein